MTDPAWKITSSAGTGWENARAMRRLIWETEGDMPPRFSLGAVTAALVVLQVLNAAAWIYVLATR